MTDPGQDMSTMPHETIPALAAWRGNTKCKGGWSQISKIIKKHFHHMDLSPSGPPSNPCTTPAGSHDVTIKTIMPSWIWGHQTILWLKKSHQMQKCWSPTNLRKILDGPTWHSSHEAHYLSQILELAKQAFVILGNQEHFINLSHKFMQGKM